MLKLESKKHVYYWWSGMVVEFQGNILTLTQRVGCKVACMHAHVRFVVAHVRVHGKIILRRACDVSASSLILGVRCATAF